jgi:16S rRNA (adenine1518-N6/adenine1519-N6)-dimethyltransferase
MGKRLSQHFLYDPSILQRIADASGVGPDDTVVEIGPGPGSLTAVLAERAGKVVAIELDRALYEKLTEKFADADNVELVRGDALSYDYSGLGPFKVVANIPYHITTPLIFKLMEHKGRLRSMTLTVQKEVARRIAASPGNKDYGVLSITVQYHARAEMRFVIPAGAFRPAPKVDSACIHIEMYDSPPVRAEDEELFKNIVRAAFCQRRKTLHNSLKTIAPDMDEVLEAAGVSPGLRPERLSVGDFARIADGVNK